MTLRQEQKTKVQQLLAEIESLQTGGDETLTRAKERAGSWLSDFLAEPLTPAEQAEWQRIVDETVMAELDGGAEEYIRAVEDGTTSISDRRQEIADWRMIEAEA